MKGRLGFRLLQLSPLAVIALIAATLFSLPGPVITSSLHSAFLRSSDAADAKYQGPPSEVTVLEAFAYGDGSESYAVSGDSRVMHRAATASGGKLRSLTPPFFSADGAPRALTIAEAERAYAPLEEFEEAHDAGVAVFTVPVESTPPVALAVLADPSVLKPDELLEYESSGTVQTLRGRVQAQESPSLPTSLDLNGSSGEEVEGRFIGQSRFMMDGHFWESFTVVPAGSLGETIMGGDWTGIDDPDLFAVAEDLAEHGKGCVFIVGPIDGDPKLVRGAGGFTEGESESAWSLWEHGSSGDMLLWGAAPLTQQESRLLGGAVYAEADINSLGVQPGIAFIGLYRQHPRLQVLRDELGRSPVTAARVWLGTSLPLVMACMLVLLLASFVAMVWSFRAERVYSERLEVERTRRRVQREAESRVVARLTELTTRMDDLMARASEDNAANVAGVAADIDATVGELRDILGSASATDGGGDG
jgi:hypothetical protein